MIRTFLLLLACLTTLPWIASVSAAPQTSVLQTRTEAALQVGVVE